MHVYLTCIYVRIALQQTEHTPLISRPHRSQLKERAILSHAYEGIPPAYHREATSQAQTSDIEVRPYNSSYTELLANQTSEYAIIHGDKIRTFPG